MFNEPGMSPPKPPTLAHMLSPGLLLLLQPYQILVNSSSLHKRSYFLCNKIMQLKWNYT